MQKWSRYRAVGYMVGRGLAFGCGPDELYPRQASDLRKYQINVDMVKHPTVAAIDDRPASLIRALPLFVTVMRYT